MADIFNSKDSVFFVGGTGTKAGLANAGGCTLTWYLANFTALTDIMAADGAALIGEVACDYDHIGGAGGNREIRQADAGEFVGAEVGMVAYISGTNITTDRYEITGIDAVNGHYVIVADIVATGDNADTVINIGGAFDTAQNAWLYTDATNGYNVIIHSNKNQSRTVGDFPAPWSLSTLGGSQVNRSFKRFVGFTTLPEDGGQITFDGEDHANFNPNGGIHFNANLYNVIFENIIVENAFINWHSDATGQYSIKLINCEGNDGGSHGFELTFGRSWALISCKAADNTGLGFDCHQGATIVNHFLLNCIAHGNGSDGFNIGGHITGLAVGCLSYDNGDAGFLTTSGFGVGAVKDCVAYDNTGHGFEFTKSNPMAINCIAKDNGGWGFFANLGGDLMAPHVENCCSHGNTGGEYSLPVALPEQNSITTDPLFVDAANQDFRLEINSPCLKTGKLTLGQL